MGRKMDEIELLTYLAFLAERIVVCDVLQYEDLQNVC